MKRPWPSKTLKEKSYTQEQVATISPLKSRPHHQFPEVKSGTHPKALIDEKISDAHARVYCVKSEKKKNG